MKKSPLEMSAKMELYLEQALKMCPKSTTYERDENGILVSLTINFL